MKIFKTIALCLFIQTFLPNLVSAQIYRCVNENGTVEFNQAGCNDASKAKEASREPRTIEALQPVERSDELNRKALEKSSQS